MAVGIYINGCSEDTEFPCIAEAKELGLKPVIFINELSRIRDVEIPILHAADMWRFNDPVVATCETTTKFLDQIPTPVEKYTLCKTIEIDGINCIDYISEIT